MKSCSMFRNRLYDLAKEQFIARYWMWEERRMLLNAKSKSFKTLKAGGEQTVLRVLLTPRLSLQML